MNRNASRTRTAYRAGVVLALTLGLLLTAPTPTHAGAGWMDKDNGELHLIAKFFYPPTPQDLATFEQTLIDASHYLCDVTEGQVRIGTVDVRGGCSEGDCQVGVDQADIWMWPTDTSGAANASICPDLEACSALGTSGSRVFLSRYYIDNEVTLVHELSHYVFDIYDEYRINGGTVPKGACIECSDMNDPGIGTTLMNAEACGTNVDYSEWCTDANHDLDQGQGAPCDAVGTVFPACGADTYDYANAEWYDQPYCDSYDPNQCRYEKAMHSWGSFAKHGEVLSAWEHAGRTWDALPPANQFPLMVPNALPSPTNNTAFCNEEPLITFSLDQPDKVALVLDRSWSMAFPPGEFEKCDPVDGCPEICDNSKDDDDDGTIDESNCSQPRMVSLRKTATHYLQLLRETPGAGIEAGITSFACGNSEDVTPQTVDDNSYATIFEPAVEDLQPNGGTAIADALEAAAASLGNDGQSRALLLVTDGFSHCDEADLDQVLSELEDDDITVYVISFGPATGSLQGAIAAAGTGGKYLPVQSARQLSPAFVRQWAALMHAGLAIPQLPFRVGQSGPPADPADIGTGAKWSRGEDKPPGIPHTSPPSSNGFVFEVEPGTERVVISLAGDLDEMSGFGIAATMTGPVGPHPNVFDSEVAAPGPWMHVHDDAHYKWIELLHPNPGTWRVDVRALLGGAYAFEQRGYVTIATENDDAFLFTDLDRRVISDPTDPISVYIRPEFGGPVRGALVTATLVRPDGSTVDLDVANLTEVNGGYLANVYDTQIPFQGAYEVRVRVTTPAATATASPGEFLEDVAIPYMERTASEYFVVPIGIKICPSGDANDCDGDGIRDESRVDDADNDGIPDSCDPDSDNDEIDDGFETDGSGSPDQDDDGDGTPNQNDPDADGDGIPDDTDPNVDPTAGPQLWLRAVDREIGTCFGKQEVQVIYTNDAPTAGFNAALTFAGSTNGLELTDLRPGDAWDPAGIGNYTTQVNPTSGLASLSMQPGDELSPGNNQHVLTVFVQPTAATVPGIDAELCFHLSPLGPTPDSTWVELGGTPTQIATYCATLSVVGDEEPPSPQCPGSTQLTADASCSASWDVQVEATDACDPSPSVDASVPIPTQLVGAGEHEVLYTATDSAQNSESCVATITVVDETAPAGGFSPPIDGACFGAPVTATTAWSDGCSASLTETMVPPGPSYNTHGAYNVVATATDEAGNQQQDVASFWIDLLKPEINRGAETSFPTDGPLTSPPFDVQDDTATVEIAALDGCEIWNGEQTLAFTPQQSCLAALSCGLGGFDTPTLSVSATDCAGNTSEASWQIELQPPMTLADCGSTLLLDDDEIVWSPAFAATSFDLVRGELSALQPASLGPLSCIVEDTTDTVMNDAATPAPGVGWFYLSRPSFAGNNAGYGTDSDGAPRVAGAGDCAP